MKVSDKKKEALLVSIVVIASMILIFYWIHLAFNKVINDKTAQIKVYKDKINKVRVLTEQLNTGDNHLKRINGGLLSFLQNQTKRLKLESKLTVIKPRLTDTGVEAAMIRFEKLKLNEIMDILQLLDLYADLKVKTMELTRRFDNPKTADLNMEILRLRN